VVADSTIHNLDILGGLLHLDEIHSTAQATLDGVSLSKADANTIVTGVTLAGEPVTIDDTGIHVVTSGDGGAAAKQVNMVLASLKSQGIVIRLASKDRSIKRGNVSASTGGVLIAFERVTPDVPLPIPPLPLPFALPAVGGKYIGSITIGGAGVIGTASSFGLPAGGGSTGSIAGGVPATEAGSQPSVSVGGISVEQPTTTTASAPDLSLSPTLPTQRSVTTTARFDTTTARLKVVLLALVGYPLLVLLGGLFRAPARFPGPT